MPSKVKKISSIFLSPLKSIITLLLCIVLFPVALFPLDSIQTLPAQNTPILLVHGYLYNKGGWLYLRYRLLKAGLGPVFTINLGYPFHCIEDYSLKIKEKAKEIAKITGRSDLILIGHSMGGIVSSYYAVHDAPENTVTDVITLGSPLKGTKMASIGIGACVSQMLPNNKFLEKLHADISKLRHTRFFNLGSKTDWMIIPQDSALYSHPEAENLVIPDMGHLQFLFSDRVAQAIIKNLQSNKTN